MDRQPLLRKARALPGTPRTFRRRAPIWRRRAERLAREIERLVEDGPLLGPQLRPRAHPLLVLVLEKGAPIGCSGPALHGSCQGADRLATGALDPGRLVLAA